MKSYKVLYVGDSSVSSTSKHRAEALKRLGHRIVHADPYIAVRARLTGRLRSAFHHRTGYRFLQHATTSWVLAQVEDNFEERPDVIWVNSGELLGPQATAALKSLGRPIVLYCNDDPTGGRDGRRFDSLLQALPNYDLCAVVREPNVSEFLNLGARDVERILMSYDEVLHRRWNDPTNIPSQFHSDVAFVGTWIRGEGREDFLLALIDHGIDVAIWGDRWQKSTSWKRLRKYWRGPSLSGQDYVSAIQGAKITLGLLSHGNRDLHTTRSMEIPYAGGLLCAERTVEHLSLYKDGEEAVYWGDVKECAAVCARLLANDDLRQRIRTQGSARVLKNRVGNEDVCRKILERLFEATATTSSALTTS